MLNRLTNKFAGLIKAIHYILNDGDEPQLYNLLIDNGQLKHILGVKDDVKLRVGGIGKTKKEALIRSIGEFIERYSWVNSQQASIFGSYKQLKSEYPLFDITKIQLFSEEQYNNPDFLIEELTEDTKLNWVRGLALPRLKEIYYPSQIVVGFYARRLGEVQIDINTSNGCASGKTYTDAILSGLYEVIERNSFLYHWFSRITPARVDFDGYFKDLTVGFGHSIYLLDISTTSIPAFLSVIIDNQLGSIKFSCGAAANLDPVRAAYKSILEAWQVRSYGKRLALVSKKEIFPSKITNLDDNLRYYLDEVNFDKLKFLINSKKVRNLNEYQNHSKDSISDFKYILHELKKRKLDILIFDLSTEESEKLGFKVVKIIIPQFISLCLPSFPYAGNLQLKMAKTLNRDPHPLP